MGVGPQDRLGRILSDWLRDRADGKERERDDVISEHPELAEGLRARFEALEVFERGGEDAPIPNSIGKYRILRELGRGAMGIVYEAEQTDLGRRVALKLLSPVIATDAAAVARFAREAQAAGRLEHRNIAAVHEFGRDKGFTFYTMELIEGSSLHDRITEQRARATRSRSWGGAGCPRGSATASSVPRSTPASCTSWIWSPARSSCRRGRPTGRSSPSAARGTRASRSSRGTWPT
ncbi:MAG: protein kinase domain-containing protein [Planctomycetota bacterium]|jgi:hypothetical protein